LPYCCQLCTYIGYEFSGLQRHLIVTPHCAYFYNEKEAITGTIPDVCTEKLKPNPSKLEIKSYKMDRYSTNGVYDHVQLNIKDDIIAKLKSVSNNHDSA
jgi:hypothetical protein